MKQKHWQVSVFDKTSETIRDDTFYTTDTEAYLVFELIDEDFTPDAVAVTVYNIYGKATINASAEIVDGIVQYEMPVEAIGHPGGWRTQVIFTKDNEDYTTGIIEFDVGGHLLDNKKPAIVDIENWNAFMATAQELLKQLEDGAGGGCIDDGELEQQYRESEQERVVAENVREANESTRQAEETQRASSESTRVDNEQQREANEQNRVTAENERNDLYGLVQQKLENGEFAGEKGETGDGLEYVWNGTQLGVRKEGETEYVYVDLKGDKGEDADDDAQTLQGRTPNSFIQVVTHNNSVDTARPVGAISVLWIGTVEPQNAIDNDLWIGG